MGHGILPELLKALQNLMEDGTSISEQDKADARLIVAAPDLFACLQNLVARKLIVGMESATGPSNDHIDEAIAAIDKALGKE